MWKKKNITDHSSLSVKKVLLRKSCSRSLGGMLFGLLSCGILDLQAEFNFMLGASFCFHVSFIWEPFCYSFGCFL